MGSQHGADSCARIGADHHHAGLYYAAIMVKATTPPTLRGADLGHATVGGTGPTCQPRCLLRPQGSALTATAPATIATPTTVATLPYVVASW